MMQRPVPLHMLFGLALLVGCAAGTPITSAAPAEPAIPAEPAMPAEPALTVETVAPACGTVFTPDPELVDEVTAIAARWSKATGCDVRVGEGGTPVRLVPEIVDGDTVRPGFTRGVEGGGYEILVSPLRFDPAAAPHDGVLMHESGHVLYPHEDELHPRGHVTAPPGVACDALMCRNGGRGLVTAADLEFICSGYPCSAFVPESGDARDVHDVEK